MSGLGCRVGRLLPRLQRLSLRVGPSNTRGLEVQINQVNVRSLVVSHRLSGQSAEAFQNVEAMTSEQKDNKVSQTENVNEELDRKLYKLDLEVRRTNRALPQGGDNSLEEIVKLLERSAVCTGTQALMLIKNFGELCTDLPKSTRIKNFDHLLKVLKPLLKLDISHMNAILRVHLENENNIDGSKFLAEIEEQGLRPNRVTYQHLIALYCSTGDIDKATTVLEQMKAEDLPINEFIFHSLLFGHTKNKDVESVNGVLEIMESSGLIKGADTYTTLLIAAARAKDWDRVEELLVETKNNDIKLNSKSYLKVIHALCENKMALQAESLIPLIPKRTGYYLDVRSTLPQIIFSGATETCMKLFGELNSGVSPSAANFLGLCFARTDTVSPEECAKVIEALHTKGFDVIPRYTKEALRNGNIGKIEALAKLFEEKGNENLKDILKNTRFYNDDISQDFEDLQKTLSVLQSLEIPLASQVIKEIIKSKYNIHLTLPATFVGELHARMGHRNGHLIVREMLLYLMDRRDQLGSNAYERYVLTQDSATWVFPSRYKISLAHSFLRTSNLNLLIVSLAAHRIQVSKDSLIKESYEFLPLIVDYQPIHQPSMSAVEIMRDVVSEINKYKLGVPREVADQLKAKLSDSSLGSLLDTAVSDFETADYWTEEKRDQLSKDLKKIVFNFQFKRDPNDLPDDSAILKSMMERSRRFNPRVANQLVSKLAEENKPDEAVAALERAIELSPDYTLSPTSCNLIVQSYIRKDDLEAAERFLMNVNAKLFYSSLINIMHQYALKGDHAKVVEMIKYETDDKFLRAEYSVNDEVSDLLKIYEDADDVTNLESVTDAFLSRRKFYNVCTASRVSIHLNRGDTESALKSFEEVARYYVSNDATRMLVGRLVEEGNIDGLQRVNDVMTKRLGQEATLFKLSVEFLLLNRREQAKPILETPGLRYNQKFVEDVVFQLNKQNRPDCLQDFIKFTKDMFGCDRDYLYMALTKQTENAEDVGKIWLDIQEEGHAPSIELKQSIAKRLTAAKMDVPFEWDISELNQIAKVRKDDVKKAKAEAASSTEKIDSTKKAEEPPSAISVAVEKKDLAAVLDVLSTENLSIGDFRKGLKFLAANNHVDELKNVIEKSSIAPARYQDTFRRSLLNMAETRGVQAVDEFLASFPERLYFQLGSQRIFKEFYSKKPEDLLVALEDNKLAHINRITFSAQQIIRLTQKDPEIFDKIEKLSAEGSTAATILGARMSCHTKDTENLVKFWSRIDDKENGQYVVIVDTLDNLRWLASTLNDDPLVVNKAANQCLQKLRDDASMVEILNFVYDKTGTLEGVGKDSLKRAQNLEGFKHSQEASNILAKQ